MSGKAAVAKRAKAARIISALRKHYPGSSTALSFRSPMEMLVSTILSAQCTDARVNIVTKELFRKYKTAKDYANADIRKLEQEIRSTGFYRNKAKNIIAAAKLIEGRFNGEVPDKMEDLVTLPGVARKTANIVLWNSYGIISGIAVDTHVTRLAYRLGLTGNTDQNKIEQDLMALYARKDWPHITNFLIAHGRAVCQAKKPLCRKCFLFRLCSKKGVDRKFWD
ncbi:endonuclease III [Candidatus Woesearchaeota archaeon]|nr:endonuclease III [Candidatus Woesearchaeota archaeon]